MFRLVGSFCCSRHVYARATFVAVPIPRPDDASRRPVARSMVYFPASPGDGMRWITLAPSPLNKEPTIGLASLRYSRATTKKVSATQCSSKASALHGRPSSYTLDGGKGGRGRDSAWRGAGTEGGPSDCRTDTIGAAVSDHRVCHSDTAPRREWRLADYAMRSQRGQSIRNTP